MATPNYWFLQDIWEILSTMRKGNPFTPPFWHASLRLSVRPSMREDIAFKVLANITWNFNLLLVLASTIQTSCHMAPPIPIPWKLGVSVLSVWKLSTWKPPPNNETFPFRVHWVPLMCFTSWELLPELSKCPHFKGGHCYKCQKKQWQEGWCHP